MAYRAVTNDSSTELENKIMDFYISITGKILNSVEKVGWYLFDLIQYVWY